MHACLVPAPQTTHTALLTLATTCHTLPPLARAKHHGNNINDHIDVLMAQISRGETKLLDITVIKATIQKNKAPKEKHVAVLKMACAGAAPRMQVRYTINQLAARLDDKPSWLVALKTLIVFHRLMREVDPSFQVCVCVCVSL